MRVFPKGRGEPQGEFFGNKRKRKKKDESTKKGGTKNDNMRKTSVEEGSLGASWVSRFLVADRY